MSDDQSNGFTEEQDTQPRPRDSARWYLPDDENWLGDPGYNPAIAEALRCAHQHLTDSKQMAYLEAFNCVAGILDAEMSRHQRLAVLFIAALALATDDPPTGALDAIDDAFDIAVDLQDEQAREDLLLLRASVNHAILQVPDAAADLRDCLNIIMMQSEVRDLTPTELDTRLEALLRLAGYEFLIGQHDRAAQLLDRAAALIPRVPSNIKAPLLLAWTRAMLLRWRGEYELALTQAMAAADGYAVHGPPATAGRIRSIVGEIALDLAERSRSNHQPLASAAWLRLAEPYIVHGIELASADDEGGTETMAAITQCRFLLLEGEGESEGRIAWLDELAQLGAEHQDSAIVAQADTQLGREYEAQGDIEAARHWYQRALAVLKESQMVALGIWAQRGLWRLQGEMNSDDRP